jgi:nitrate reductase gamma subunit
MTELLLFAVLPYVVLAILLIGSIYRYTNKGFKVSSLSSQFLEGRKLFWGSQPFHWGLMFLFFGHLVAFMFPRAVLAWNGQPVRLIILEMTAFAFALSALFGLILLIRRRLTEPRVKIVTTWSDAVVYALLLVQIVSGLSVAFFERWGSSWFAATLTPYLRSIFTFNPEIGAVGAMPLMVKIHVVTAFLIIGFIPFTRFMHFLVFPLDYVWRSYQQVVWNWDHKTIRTSRHNSPGKKSLNN